MSFPDEQLTVCAGQLFSIAGKKGPNYGLSHASPANHADGVKMVFSSKKNRWSFVYTLVYMQEGPNNQVY